jgi:hypothetical protein
MVAATNSKGRIAVGERRDGFVVLAIDKFEDGSGEAQDSVQERVVSADRGVAVRGGHGFVDRPDHRAFLVDHGQGVRTDVLVDRDVSTRTGRVGDGE